MTATEVPRHRFFMHEPPHLYARRIKDFADTIFNNHLPRPVEIAGLPLPAGVDKETLFNYLETNLDGDTQKIAFLRKVYEFADNRFQSSINPLRDSGDEKITHSLWMTILLTSVGIKDQDVLAATVLHDVKEDTATDIAEITTLTNPVVAGLVEAITKVKTTVALGKNKQSIDRQHRRDNYATIQKLLASAMLEDPRSILIKLADVVHNMLTLDTLDQAASVSEKFSKRKEKAQLALEIYVPLALAFGLEGFARIIGDQAFKMLRPKTYQTILRAQNQLPADLPQLFKNAADEWILTGKGMNQKLAATSVNISWPGIYATSLNMAKERRKQVSEEDVLPTIQIICPAFTDVLVWADYLSMNFLSSGHNLSEVYDLLKQHQPVQLRVPIIAPGKDGETTVYNVLVSIATSDISVKPYLLYIDSAQYDEFELQPAKLQLEAFRNEYEEAVKIYLSPQAVTRSIKESINTGTLVVFDESGNPVTVRQGATWLDVAFGISRRLGAQTVQVYIMREEVWQGALLTDPAVPNERVIFITPDKDLNDLQIKLTQVKTSKVLPTMYDQVNSPKSLRDITWALTQTDLAADPETIRSSAQHRAIDILCWLYEELHPQHKRADEHPVNAFTPEIGQKYRTYAEFLYKLGMVALPAIQQRYLEFWQQPSSKKHFPVILDAFRVAHNLLNLRNSLPTILMGIHDQPGVLAQVGEIIKTALGSAMPIHGRPEFHGPGVVDGKQPASIEIVLKEGNAEEITALIQKVFPDARVIVRNAVETDLVQLLDSLKT